MLSEKRHKLILEFLDEEGEGTIKKLSEITGTSESTIRRDLTRLAEKGLINKVYGGATTKDTHVSTEEPDMLKKHNLYTKEKEAIGKYAASLIKKGDFVFIDAGTTTETIVNYLTEHDATYMTNGLFQAQLLTGRGFNTLVVGGMIRPRTEAIVGNEAIDQIKNCNFSIGFFGVNGITLETGYTTPNIIESAFKEEALRHTLRAYIVADPSKFGKIYPKTFGQIDQAEIITTELDDESLNIKTSVKEVYK